MALHILWNFGVRRVDAAVFAVAVILNCSLLRLWRRRDLAE